MSDYVLKTILIVGSVALTAVIFQLIRKRKLREEYGLLWMGGSITLLLVSCFAKPLGSVTLTLVGIPFALLIILSQSVKLSAHQDCIRDLAQYTALLEWRLQQLEEDKQQIPADAFPVDLAISRREPANELLEQ